MNKTGYFKLTVEEEDYLWNKAIIVLDTSTLGNLYCLAEEPKKTLLEIFDIVKHRIWLPGYVVYEYTKNREELVENSFQSYFLPKEGVYVNRYESEMNAFLDNHRNDNYHPYLEQQSLEKIGRADTIIRENLRIIKEEIKAQYAKRQQSLKDELKDDKVQHFVEGIANGEPFDYATQVAIIKEGEIRYRNLVPPGYEDAPPFTLKKKGLQRYGDLIIWKEILRYAKECNLPVLFVCNDLKNDWWQFTDSNKPTSTPRHELIKEFHDETGQLFWMYSLKDFINKLGEKYKDSGSLPLFSKLETVKRVLISNENKQRKLRYKNPEDVLVIKCDACDDIIVVRKDEIDWDWESVSSDEREMGEEIEFEHEEYFDCDNGHEVKVTFKLWEYPVGMINDHEIECDGGEIEEEFDFTDTLPMEVEEEKEEVCWKCGQHGYTDDMGLCTECRREYQEFIDKDD